MARDKWIWAMWIFYEIGMETEREEVGKFLNDRGVLFWINRFSPKCDQYTEKQVKFPMKTYHIRISQFKSNNKTSWKTKPSYLLQDFHKDFPVPFPFTYFLCPFSLFFLLCLLILFFKMPLVVLNKNPKEWRSWRIFFCLKRTEILFWKME